MLRNVNNRIKKEFCIDTFEKLSTKVLLPEYLKSYSVIRNINHLKSILRKNNVQEENIDNIINEYIYKLIPPGTKGCIRGRTFNSIIKYHILSIPLSSRHFTIEFEKKHNLYLTNEIPDWTIFEPKTGKLIVGMNQLDLWSGGQQKNRGNKYIYHETGNKKIKMLNVICHKTYFKTRNSVFNLFCHGFKNDNLCYITGLQKIIYDFFGVY
jgi:hypothetical protein